MIYATRLPTQFDNLQANFNELLTDPGLSGLLADSIQVAIDHTQSTPPISVVYTDDWSPIEWVTNQMVLNYVLFGDLEQIGH
jgi:hypothetical protein